VPTFLRFIRKPRLPNCSICNEPVEVEIAKTDENGKAVHEDSYVRLLRIKKSHPRPKPRNVLEQILVTIENAGRTIVCHRREPYEPFCRARKTASLSDLTNQQLNMYALAASAAGVGRLA
jgi:hypothetical protein